MRKNVFRIFFTLLVVAPLFWWGGIYPDFALVDGTYEIVVRDGEELPPMSQEEEVELILHAKQGQIRIKSKLWEYIFNGR